MRFTESPSSSYYIPIYARAYKVLVPSNDFNSNVVDDELQ